MRKLQTGGTHVFIGCEKTLTFALSLLLAAAAFAQQNAPVPVEKNSGLYERASLSVGHDSSAGWSGEVDSAVGYDFSRTISLEAGAPFYLDTTQSTSATGTSTTSRTETVGDAYVRFGLQNSSQVLHYSTGLTATAPTGDTGAGVSTGRATFNWSNRLEHGFDRITPFGEGSFGNSLTGTRRYRRAYTTLGAVSEFRGGVGFDLFKSISLETSAYGDVGYGNQKVYSRKLPKSARVIGLQQAAAHNRVFEDAFLTTGSSTLVNDKGLTADLSCNLTRRLDLDLAYNRSLHFMTDSVSFTIGMRFGHLLPKKS